MTATERGFHLTRGHKVGLAMIIAFAFGGWVLGIRPMPKVVTGRPPVAEASGNHPPSTSYRGLRHDRRGSGREVTSNVGAFDQLPVATGPIERNPEALAAALALRATRRAYDGAPPVVPHPIAQQSSTSCLSCHRDGARLGDRIAPAISHPAYQSCTQCHASVAPRWTGEAATGEVANSFAGRRWPDHGPTAWTGAPPRIPHSTWMRDSCGACHGPNGRPGIRTTHPERQSCTQCHVARESSQPWM